MVRCKFVLVIALAFGCLVAGPIALTEPDPLAGESESTRRVNPTALPKYKVVDLGFAAVAINDDNRVVGHSNGNVVTWDFATGLTDLGSGVAVDIDNHGRVLGKDPVGYFGPGWIADADGTREYPDSMENPAAMNDLGQVVGFPTPEDRLGGYLWDAATGFETILNPGNPPVGSSTDAWSTDISNNGLVVGWLDVGDGYPFHWRSGDLEANWLPGFLSATDIGAGEAVNDLGVIAGQILLADREPEPPYPGDPLGRAGCDGVYCYRAALWNENLAARLIAAGRALDVNNQGVVVGTGDEFGPAFMWSEEYGLVELSTLIAADDPFHGSVSIQRASKINENGWIIADAQYLLIPEAVDSDADGVADDVDNCTLVANPDQRDTNKDLIGNACDADLTGDCAVGFQDLAMLVAAFHPRPYDPDADFDGNGFVSFGDLAFMRSSFFNGENPGPGPGAPGNACE